MALQYSRRLGENGQYFICVGQTLTKNLYTFWRKTISCDGYLCREQQRIVERAGADPALATRKRTSYLAPIESKAFLALTQKGQYDLEYTTTPCFSTISFTELSRSHPS